MVMLKTIIVFLAVLIIRFSMENKKYPGGILEWIIIFSAATIIVSSIIK